MLTFKHKHFNLTLLALLVLSGLMPCTAFAADTIETVFVGIGKSVSPIPKLMMWVCYILGLVSLVMGLIKLKDTVDDPGKNKIQSGVITLVVGMLLIALPTAIQLGQSLTGAKIEILAKKPTMGSGFDGINR